MRMAVTAAPSSDESKMRRSDEPRVCPHPGSNGSMRNTPIIIPPLHALDLRQLNIKHADHPHKNSQCYWQQ